MGHDAAKAFPAELVSLIEEKGYLPEQVFNADETVLFWKKMSTRMFISQCESKSASFKGTKDRGGLHGIPSPLRKCRRGLHGKSHDALPCAEEQKQAGATHVMEGEQEGVGDV